MTSPDPYINANRLREAHNAVAALAAHLNLVLDQHGHTVTLPDGAPLAQVIAEVLYARHAGNPLIGWASASDGVRGWWEVQADAVIDAPRTATPAELASLIHARVGIGPWVRITSGDLAHFLITAQHVARLIANGDQDLDREPTVSVLALSDDRVT